MLRKAERQYQFETTTISKYVQFQMLDVINTIEAYLNSKHTSGEKDSLNRDKPFFNIVTAASNIWFRATDLDRKDIKIKPSKNSEILPAFLATMFLHDWMNKQKFGEFLNEWGRVLARYGSAVVKFVEKGNDLNISITPWNRIICDQVDFDSNAQIEILEFTEAQLRAKIADGYDKEAVNNLCNAFTARKTIEGQIKDTKSYFIKCYEMHGIFSKQFLTGKPEDKDIFVQQMQVLSYISKGETKTGDQEFEDFTLFKGLEKKSPNMITHLIKEDGRTLSIGAVEHLFQSQWMVNHSIKSIKDNLDLVSKVVFQTADSSFIGQNVLTAIENGDIMIHKENMPLEAVVAHAGRINDVSTLQSVMQQWQTLSQDISATPDSIRGNNLPSGTPYSLGAILQNQALSLFEIMTENKGLYVEDMLRERIIPHIKSKHLSNSNEIVAELDDNNIQKIDAMYVPREAIKRYNNKVKSSILKGKVPKDISLQNEQGQVQDELGNLGNQRFFKPSDITTVQWNNFFKDFEWTVDVQITGENSDKQATLTTLTTMLQTIAGNPAILQDPNARMLFNQILSEAGVLSPIQFSTASPAPAQNPTNTPAAPPNGGKKVGTGSPLPNNQQ